MWESGSLLIFFARYVDIGFGIGDVWEFELWVEYEVGYENESSVDKYIKGEVDVECFDSVGWCGVEIDYIKYFGLEIEDGADYKKDISVGKGVNI